MLETERDYFDKHRDDLLRQYPGKFVVIKDQQLLGSYDTIQDALGAGAREFGMVSFLVRRTDQVAEEITIPALTLDVYKRQALSDAAAQIRLGLYVVWQTAIAARADRAIGHDIREGAARGRQIQQLHGERQIVSPRPGVPAQTGRALPADVS